MIQRGARTHACSKLVCRDRARFYRDDKGEVAYVGILFGLSLFLVVCIRVTAKSQMLLYPRQKLQERPSQSNLGRSGGGSLWSLGGVLGYTEGGLSLLAAQYFDFATAKRCKAGAALSCACSYRLCASSRSSMESKSPACMF